MTNQLNNPEPIIHYIGPEWKTIFIIAKTSCGKDWRNVNETSSNKEIITCKKCQSILIKNK